MERYNNTYTNSYPAHAMRAERHGDGFFHSMAKLRKSAEWITVRPDPPVG